MKVSGSNRTRTTYDEENYYQRRPARDDNYGNRETKKTVNNNSHKNKSRKKSKRKKIRKVIGIFLMMIYAALIIVFGILIFKYQLLSWSVCILILIVLLALLLIIFLTQRKKPGPGQMFGMILAGILSIALIAGCSYYLRGVQTLKTMTGEKYSYKTYNVAVRASDPAENLEDVADYTFGTIARLDSNRYFLAATVELTNQLKKEVKMVDYNSLPEAYKALSDKKIGVLFYEDSYTSSLGDIDADYEKNIKIIATIELKEIADDAEAVSVDVLNHPFIIFLSGGDDYEELSLDGRCDAIVLAVVNPNTHQILLISMQRDYYVHIAGISGLVRDKFTHSGMYGIQCSIDTLNLLFGCDVNYYFRLNFTSLMNIVDAVGGVTLYNAYAFDAPEDELHFPEGTITLNGFEALQYARERKTLQWGDLARASHQQIVIEALVDKLTSPATLALYYNNLMSALEKGAITNMSNEEILAIIRNQITNGPDWELNKYICDGYNMYQPSYAMGGMELDVCIPYKECVEFASNLITRVMSGQKLGDISSEEPTEFTLICDPITVEEFDALAVYGDDDSSDDAPAGDQYYDSADDTGDGENSWIEENNADVGDDIGSDEES